MIKRSWDIFLALIGCTLFFIPALLIAIAVKCTSKGPVLYWSERVGQYGRVFLMPKFRSMFIDTPVLAKHLIDDPQQYITPLGRWLRLTSLDEIPQVWSVLKGDMSFVGPRPALTNQVAFNRAREEAGIDQLKPGITGLAQVLGRDDFNDARKLYYDTQYLHKQSFLFDLKIILLTLRNTFIRHRISH